MREDHSKYKKSMARNNQHSAQKKGRGDSYLRNQHIVASRVQVALTSIHTCIASLAIHSPDTFLILFFKAYTEIHVTETAKKTLKSIPLTI